MGAAQGCPRYAELDADNGETPAREPLPVGRVHRRFGRHHGHAASVGVQDAVAVAAILGPGDEERDVVAVGAPDAHAVLVDGGEG